MRSHLLHNLVQKDKAAKPVPVEMHERILEGYRHSYEKTKNPFTLETEPGFYHEFIRHFPHTVVNIYAERKSHHPAGNAFAVSDTGFARLWLINPYGHKWHETNNHVTVCLEDLCGLDVVTYFVDYCFDVDRMEIEYSRHDTSTDNTVLLTGKASIRGIRYFVEEFHK